MGLKNFTKEKFVNETEGTKGADVIYTDEVFDEAESRMYTIKAVMAVTLRAEGC